MRIGLKLKRLKYQPEAKMRGAEPIFIDKKSKVGILMLHGFTSTPYQFKELSQYLSAKGFTVYAPIIAGHGTSPKELIKTTAEDWKASVKEAYVKLKTSAEKIVVIGNSFGGNLAFWLARTENNLNGIISLGTPIFLKYQWFIMFRYYLYGWAKKYYRKPQKAYKIDYTDMADEVTYPVIPIKSFMEFLRFLKEETIPHLKQIKVPSLITHANIDPIVDPKSASYIYEHLGSNYKRIYWFESNHHVVTNDARREELFQKIYDFIKEIT